MRVKSRSLDLAVVGTASYFYYFPPFGRKEDVFLGGYQYNRNGTSQNWEEADGRGYVSKFYPTIYK